MPDPKINNIKVLTSEVRTFVFCFNVMLSHVIMYRAGLLPSFLKSFVPFLPDRSPGTTSSTNVVTKSMNQIKP